MIWLYSVYLTLVTNALDKGNLGLASVEIIIVVNIVYVINYDILWVCLLVGSRVWTYWEEFVMEIFGVRVLAKS